MMMIAATNTHTSRVIFTIILSQLGPVLIVRRKKKRKGTKECVFEKLWCE